MTTFFRLPEGARFISMEVEPSDHEFVKLAYGNGTKSEFDHNCECGISPGYTWNAVNEHGIRVHFCNNIKVRQIYP